ncbi:hypothetical protein CALCODRAFT_504577 [Calocera cornea HHB12733]|uniref:MYND-type domain-containing protein n=1 Tax=Calocera cornea HHB12733 TaxID=1353952 RepID=A0A165CCD4_9BASI|nr:hypothetical protein CALCODRAFT_504577 [Calocera cornea HHB12733]
MAQYSPAENEAIFSRLAAAYLPRLVDAALEQPIIVDTGLVGFINGYIAALEAIQRCAPGFLVGYMDSADPTTSGKGRMLPSRLAQLIGIAALIRQDHVGTGQPLSVYHKEVHLGQYAGLCTLLLFLIAWLPDDRKSAVFSEPLRAFLSKLVSSWLAQLSGIPLESHFRQIFTVLKLVLRGSVWDVDKLRNLRVPFPHYNLAKCHLSVCDKAVGSDQIYQCARCRTVLYCSKAHQKADWDDPRTPHGAMCYSRAW